MWSVDRIIIVLCDITICMHEWFVKSVVSRGKPVASTIYIFNAMQMYYWSLFEIATTHVGPSPPPSNKRTKKWICQNMKIYVFFLAKKKGNKNDKIRFASFVTLSTHTCVEGVSLVTIAVCVFLHLIRMTAVAAEWHSIPVYTKCYRARVRHLFLSQFRLHAGNRKRQKTDFLDDRGKSRDMPNPSAKTENENNIENWHFPIPIYTIFTSPPMRNDQSFCHKCHWFWTSSGFFASRWEMGTVGQYDGYLYGCVANVDGSVVDVFFISINYRCTVDGYDENWLDDLTPNRQIIIIMNWRVVRSTCAHQKEIVCVGRCLCKNKTNRSDDAPNCR